MIPPTPPKDAALLLDFDGTLVAIAARPQDVRVPDWLVPTLQRWSDRLEGALALVSGRPIEQLDDFLAPWRGAAAGAHGAQMRGIAGGKVELLAPDAPPPALVARAQALAAAYEGLLFEPKPSGFALHYRARPELELLCRSTLSEGIAALPAPLCEQWVSLAGHCVVELKPRGISKGHAVRALLRQPAFRERVPIFVGDDVTDEDGIRAVQQWGGFGVRVGPGDSQARFRLPDAEAVGVWLRAPLGAIGPDRVQ